MIKIFIIKLILEKHIFFNPRVISKAVWATFLSKVINLPTSKLN